MSAPEDLLAFQLKAVGIPFEREVEFARPERKFRADFLVSGNDYHDTFFDAPLIVEVEGGTYIAGRHTQGAAFEGDCVKQAEALIRGYRYLRVTPHMIEDGRALAYIEGLLR